MTALDDALASNSIVLGPHQIKALWRETSNEDIATNPDAVGNLTDQHDGSMSVTHSLNDGLPDSVTMTTGNDASGTLSAGLNGREGLTLGTSGQRAWSASGGASGSAATTIPGNIPSVAVVGDYLLCAVVVNDATATLVQTYIDPKDNWENLGSVADGTGLALYLYGSRTYYTGRKPLALTSDKPVSYVSMTTAFWARNPLGIPLPYKVTNPVLAAESVSGTAHSVSGRLQRKGFQVGIWGSLSGVGPWTGTVGGMTEWNETVAVGLDLMLSTSALRESGINVLTANSTSATAVAVMGTVAMEPYARPRLDGRQYFSPFNADSPIYSFERDTADVLASIRVLTTGGPVDTQIFKGQMQDTPVSGRAAELTAQSKARILLNRTVNLPIVSARREGLGLDWVATWLLARGGSFAGAAPNQYTRFWNTFYGSIHNHWGTVLDYNTVFNYRSDIVPAGAYGTVNPPTVVGPKGFPAMFAQQTATRTDEIVMRPNAQMHNYPTDDFPHLYENGGTGPLMADFMSGSNSKGRLSFWIRGDAAVGNPAYLSSVGADDSLAYFSMYSIARGPGTNFLGYVRFYISSTTRQPVIQMGATTIGFGNVTPGAPYALPTDNAWHFIGFWWNYATGEYHMRIDNTWMASVSNFFATNGWNYTADLPPTEREVRAAGGKTEIQFRSHLPISDLLIDAGNPMTTPGTFWNDLYPTPALPGANATIRPTFQKLTGLAVPDGVNAWEALADVAQSSLAAYRVDENDAINFLPPAYFGEAAQMTSSSLQDVQFNASELDVTLDPSKTRNVVTVQFQDIRMDSKYSPVLDYSTAFELPPGTTIVTFPLDVPAVEIHGAATTNGSTYQFINLTAAQIAAPATIPTDRHWISVAAASDGTGAVYPEVQVSAKFLSVTAGTAVVQFVNKTKKTVYLANNGSEVPYMRILGYGLRGGDGYATFRDEHSVAVRRERGLDTQLNWVQDRDTANELAALLIGTLSQPRAEIALRVVGDPRRKPGQLITVADAEGTQAAGTWRILSITHNTNGAEYTQDLRCVQQYPVATWGGPNGWGIGVWGEG